MPIRVLGTYGYRGELDYERSKAVDFPSWHEIEAALRNLDAGTRAGIVLHKDDYRVGDRATDCLAVTGGPDGYLVTCVRPGTRDITLIEPSESDGNELVCVCPRDQGVWVPSRKVCRNFEAVLAAARYYADFGEPLPTAEWD